MEGRRLATDVRVVGAREPAVGPLDRLLVGGRRQVEDAQCVGAVEGCGQGGAPGARGAAGGYGAAYAPGPTEEPQVTDDPTTLATTAEERALARRAWIHLEVVHVTQYFSPTVAAAHAELGLELPWGGYTAGRIACMGRVGPELATAVFYGFAPRLLQGALPAAWDAVSPEDAHAATLEAVGETLAPLLAPFTDEVTRAAELARQAALLQPTVGRPLAAARAATAWPEDPNLVLFEAAARVRESRGDGHVATLVAAGIDGCESHLTLTGDTEKVRRVLQPRRGWTDAEWQAAVQRLRERGLLDDAGDLTAAGRELRARIELRTDALAVPPWRAFGRARTEQLIDALAPIARTLADTDLVPGVVARQLDR